MHTPVAIRPLSEITGEAFAADIRKAMPEGIRTSKWIAPMLIVIIGEKREERRDIVLSLIQGYLEDIYKQRTVFISDYPAEIPARPPKEDSSMEEYTYAPALFSVSPEGTQLPDAGLLDTLRGPQPATTRLAKTIADFTRWDIDIFAVLSPLETYSWQTCVTVSLTGMMCFTTIERKQGEQVRIGESAIQALAAVGGESDEGNVTFIDIDQKKIFRTLAEANITV